MTKILTLIGCLLLTSLVYASPAPPSAIRGGVLTMTLPQVSSSPPHVFWQKRRIMVRALKTTPQRWQAVVGIPLSASLGQQQLRVQTKALSQLVPFIVTDHAYPEQHITLKKKKKRYVSPSKPQLQRIKREAAQIQQALAHWRATPPATLRLTWPVKGPISSAFGLKRFFNGQARRPHSGLDIAAAQLTPVVAAGPGVVQQTGDYFFNGKTVIVDHGQGLFTIYCHLHDIRVRPQQTVSAQTVLGRVGQTGRATGPHLHWSVILNHARVDPKALLTYPKAP